MAESTVSKDDDVFSPTTHPETIRIHIIWRGKLNVFSVAQGETVKQQILFASTKLNQILTEMDKNGED